MTTDLRKTVRGGWWGGLGQSGEVEEEGHELPGGNLDQSSGEFNWADLLYKVTPNTTPGPEFTAEEFAAEQTRARDWLAALPNVLSTTEKVLLSATQIASGLKSGAVKPSSTCPSGYLASGTGQCVSAAPNSTSAQWIPGIPNQTVLIAGAAFLLLIVLGKKR